TSTHPALTVGFVNPQFILPVGCTQNSGPAASGSPIVIPLRNGPFSVPANDNTTQPTTSQNSAGSYGGAVQAPDLCNGGAMYSQQASGTPYVTIDDLQSTTSDGIDFQ